MTYDATNDDTSRRLIALGTSTLAECGATSIDPSIRPMWPGAQIAAPAFTVSCAAGDNLAIHAGVARAPRGTVLVASTPDDTPRGFFGEVLATGAEVAGIVGLITDGTVRDLAALEAHRFPVFARGIGIRGASKFGPGSTGEPIVLGGVVVAAGDWLVADADGVVVIAVHALSSTLELGTDRAEKETSFFARLRAGETTVGILGLDISTIR